jgi:hypothetical protein
VNAVERNTALAHLNQDYAPQWNHGVNAVERAGSICLV